MNSTCRIILALLFVILLPALSNAALLETVTNTNDSGPGSLRQALADVDPFGEVRLDASIDGMTIALTSGELVIDKQISLVGANAPNLIIDGSASPDMNVIRIADAILIVFIGTVNITGDPVSQTAIAVGSGITLTAARVRTFVTFRGVVVMPNARVDAFSSTFESHGGAGVQVLGGAGAVSGGILSCNECLIANNFDGVAALGGADGSADGGSAGVSESLIIGNQIGMVARGGMADSAEGANLTSRQSTFQNNDVAMAVFSGIQDSALGASMDVLNTTITGSTNVAIFAEGALADTALGSTVKVSFSTITQNEDGLQVDPPDNGNNGQIEVKNSIVSESSLMDCRAAPGEIDASGLNFDTDGTCNTLDMDFTTTTAMALNLGPLQNNGGMTETFDLLIPSVAIDAAPDCTDVDGDDVIFDQRLFPRPFGPNCDVGTVEQQPTGMLTLTKVSIPAGGTGFLFTSEGFPLGCEFSSLFSLDDGETVSCIIPPTVVEITDLIALNAGVNFACTEQPVNQTFDSITLDIGDGDDVTCTITNDTRPLILNEIFPSIASNLNIIDAVNATSEGQVAFIWGFLPGSLILNGPRCNGLELDIANPQLLAIVNALSNGEAEYIFWIPLIGDFELPILTQAIDVDTCRTSETVLNIIRKE